MCVFLRDCVCAPQEADVIVRASLSDAARVKQQLAEAKVRLRDPVPCVCPPERACDYRVSFVARVCMCVIACMYPIALFRL